MNKIKLSRDLFAEVDDDIYEKYKNFNFWACKPNNIFYAATRLKNGWKSKILYLHRLIMNAKEGQIVDHKDGNGLNCKRDNLRFATKSQNAMNSNIRKQNKTSKYKGVYLIKEKGKYRASLQLKGKKISLGCYKTEKEAGEAYKKGADFYFGEYAKK